MPSDDDPAGSRAVRHAWTAVAVIAVAAVFAANVLRAVRLPISIDEATTFEWYLLPSLGRGSQELFRFDANNHFLGTILERVSIALLGVDVLPLRLPALLGEALYLGAAVVAARRVVGSTFLLPALVAALALNPLVRDFSIAARGYGLAFGLSMAVLALLCLSVPVGGARADRTPLARAFAGRRHRARPHRRQQPAVRVPGGRVGRGMVAARRLGLRRSRGDRARRTVARRSGRRVVRGHRVAVRARAAERC